MGEFKHEMMVWVMLLLSFILPRAWSRWIWERMPEFAERVNREAAEIAADDERNACP